MTINDHEGAIKLLRLAQQGDRYSEHELLQWIFKTHMGKRIGRYLNRNRQAENDDLKQEFMIGCAKAIKIARPDIGDPIEYIIHQGVYGVRGYLRSQIKKNTMQICQECGYTTRLNRIDNEYICKRCGSSNVSTHELQDHNEILLANAEDEDISIEDEIVSEMLIAAFEQTLTEGTNVYNLYMLLKQGINRDNPNIKNYIKEISIRWGGCSEQNVVQALNKLQKRIIKFANDNGMDIAGHQFVERD